MSSPAAGAGSLDEVAGDVSRGARAGVAAGALAGFVGGVMMFAWAGDGTLLAIWATLFYASFIAIPGCIVGALVGAVYAYLLRGSVPPRRYVVAIAIVSTTVGFWAALSFGYMWEGSYFDAAQSIRLVFVRMGLVGGAAGGWAWHRIWCGGRVPSHGTGRRATLWAGAIIVAASLAIFGLAMVRRMAWPVLGVHRIVTMNVHWYENTNVPGRIVYQWGKYGHTLPPIEGLQEHLEQQDSIQVPLEIDIEYEGTRAVGYYPRSIAGFPLMSPLYLLGRPPADAWDLPVSLGGDTTEGDGYPDGPSGPPSDFPSPYPGTND